ncbi:MAG TPA: LuxR C-terminal-related transcriptional regulator [Gemmataceae bacterium]|nr:LuxR C-terminal-related transcriptional regulator [Gemmataceae bacterium]
MAGSALRASEAKPAVELADARQLQWISSRLIEEDNIDALYEQILDAARAVLRSDMASLQAFVPDRNELLLLAQSGFEPESAGHWKRVGSTTICGRAMASGGRVIVPDLECCDFPAGTEDLAPYRLSGIRATQSTRLVSRGGRLVGMISTHWREPHAPSERELSLFDVLARQAADLIERRATEEVLRRSEAKYRSLFETIGQGYVLGELVRDSSGAAIDQRYLEIKPAFERLLGVPVAGAAGRLASEVFPGIEAWWTRTFDRILRAGEPGRVEHLFNATGQVVAELTGTRAGTGDDLSDREAQVLRLVAQGFLIKQIAAQLGVEGRTVETYQARAMEKLGLKTRVDVVRYAGRRGWLKGD